MSCRFVLSMIDLLDYLFSSPSIDIFEYFLFYSWGYYEFETFVINVPSFVIEKYNESLNTEGLWYNNWKWGINSFFYYLCCERIKNFVLLLIDREDYKYEICMKLTFLVS